MAAGTKEDPWLLKTPPRASEYSMYEDPQAELTHDARNNQIRSIR